MCFATAALIATTVGAGVTAYGQHEAGQAAGAAANYGATVARNNEIIANQNADYAIASGLQKSETTSRKSAAVGGRIKAAQAANNVDVNSGSAVEVQAGQREAGELDAETVLNNAELTAYGYRSQGKNYEAEAKLKDASADQARIGGDFAAAGGLLGSASSLGTKWTSLGTTGSPGGAFPPAQPEDI
jgi:hypothetical protein